MGEGYFARAAARFAQDTRVHALCGDSAKLLPEVLKCFFAPCLIWLDAHPGEIETAGTYGETPLRDELRAALFAMHCNSVILVDDARLFGEPGWPTLDEVREIAAGWDVTLADDIVRITK
jgi:hypothetical protein